MKKLFILLFAVSIVCLTSCYLNNALANINDGYFWTEISDREKQAYITGVIDGAITVGVEIKLSVDNNVVKQQVSCILDNFDLKEQFTIPQVVGSLNQFYDDYANKKIPIDCALVIVMKRLRGFSESELQKAIEILRQAASKISSKQ